MKFPTSLLMPLAVIAIGATASGADSATTLLSKSWTESVRFESTKNYDDALKQMLAYQQQGGDRFLTLMRTAWLCYLKKDHAKASDFYLAASQLQPAALNPLLGRLNIAQAQNDQAKILIAAENVLRVEPSNYKAQIAQAGAYYANKDYRKALSAYRRVLTYYPDDSDATSGEAWCAYFLADPRQALRGFTKLLSVNPVYPYAQQGYDLCGGNKPRISGPHTAGGL